MNLKHRPQIHPTAYADLDLQLARLQENHCSSTTLHKFLDAIEEATTKIQNNPLTWSRVSSSSKIRKVQIKDFRMTVFYIIRKNKIPLILEFAGPGLLPRWTDRL